MTIKDLEGHKALEIRKNTVRFRISVPKDVAILLANIADELQLSIPTPHKTAAPRALRTLSWKHYG